jgi:hypothetical protein
LSFIAGILLLSEPDDTARNGTVDALHHAAAFAPKALRRAVTPERVAEVTRRGGRGRTTMVTVLIVLLVLMLVGALPAWPHSRGWGYFPSGGLGLILLVLIILALSGRL